MEGIAPERMAALVERLGRNGAQPRGGIVRPVYSPAWVQARDTIAELAGEAGLEVRVDPVGNVYGRLAGRRGGDCVVTGSHFDTVPFGGAYDGALGVLSGIAALGALRAAYGTPERTLEAVALCEEEGSRFAANFLGTRAIWGLVGESELDALRGRDGVSAADALRAAGGDPARLAGARRDDVACFLELHAEQGPNLEQRGVDLGVVTGIVGWAQLAVTVSGRADHAGTTSMTARHDALLAAAEISLEVERAAVERGHPAVGTVGRVETRPGAANIVPGEVNLSIDVRHPDDGVLAALVDDVVARVHAAATTRGCTAAIDPHKRTPPHALDAGLRERLHHHAARLGYSTMDLPSGAGHDSQVWARFVPTAMLFVPSVAGRSHCPEELTHPEDAARGATVLAATLHDLAYESG